MRGGGIPARLRFRPSRSVASQFTLVVHGALWTAGPEGPRAARATWMGPATARAPNHSDRERTARLCKALQGSALHFRRLGGGAVATAGGPSQHSLTSLGGAGSWGAPYPGGPLDCKWLFAEGHGQLWSQTVSAAMAGPGPRG